MVVSSASPWTWTEISRNGADRMQLVILKGNPGVFGLRDLVGQGSRYYGDDIHGLERGSLAEPNALHVLFS